MGKKGICMIFDTARDAKDYIAENNLWDVPVSLEFDFHRKPKIEVWYGNFAFGTFRIANDDNYDLVIIHDISEKILLENDDDEIEDYMTSNAYMSYLIPSEWKHEIVYSAQYVRDNAL